VAEKEEEITQANVLRRISRRILLSADCCAEIAFAASHSVEFAASGLGALDFSVLSRVLSSHELKIESEDWLSGIVWSLFDRGHNFFLCLDSSNSNLFLSL
jgi:hypothetical protein